MVKGRAFMLIVVLMYLGVVVALAQRSYTVRGAIKSTSGTLLSGVVVAVDGTQKGVVTGVDGRYALDLQNGKYIIYTQCIGFEKSTRGIKIQSRDIDCDFDLVENSTEIDAVKVTHESDITKAKQDIYSISAIDIDSKIGSIQNLSSVVEGAVGVRMRRDGGLGSNYELTLNGMGGNSIRYFMDGVPLDTKGGDFSMDNIPSNIVDRIEVYKGVVPSHLGGDALGGAIDIITKKDKRNYFDLSYGAGSFHTHVADFNGQVVAPKSGITVKPTISYSYSKNDYTMKNVRVVTPDYKYEYGDYKRFHDAYRSLFGQIEVGVTDRKWADQLFVGVSYNDIEKDIQTGATQDVVYGGAVRLSEAKSVSMRYRKADFFTKGLTVSANGSHTFQAQTVVDTTMMLYYWNGFGRPMDQAEISSYPITRYYDRPLSTARANIDYKIGDWSAVNFNYLINRTESVMSQHSDTDDSYNSEGATDVLTRQYLGLSYDLDLFDNRWYSTIFAKEYINKVAIDEKEFGGGSSSNANYDSDRNTTSHFTSYGLGSRYKFKDEIALRASYEYSVRLPGSTELLGDGENINPNYALEPEKSNNYNVSLYGTVGEGVSTFNYEVGGFYRDIYDFIMAVQGSESYTYTNLSNILISGVESELSYTYNNALNIRGNITYEHAIDKLKTKIEDGKPNASYKQNIPNRPSFYYNASVSYTFRNLLDRSDRLMFEYRYDYTKWFYLTWETYGHKDSKAVIPTQQNHSATLSYSWDYNKYSVSFDCNNIFDELLYDNYRLQKPGRAFFCKFRLFFR